MSRLAEMTIDQWIGLVGLIVFGSVLMWSIVSRQKPPSDGRK
jgi:hypothetical protein